MVALLGLGTVKRNESAIRIANEAMALGVCVQVESGDYASRVNRCSDSTLSGAGAGTRGVNRDDRRLRLSKSGRTNQRSTNKYAYKQLNGNSEHVHFDLSSVSLHGRTPFPNSVD